GSAPRFGEGHRSKLYRSRFCLRCANARAVGCVAGGAARRLRSDIRRLGAGTDGAREEWGCRSGQGFVRQPHVGDHRRAESARRVEGQMLYFLANLADASTFFNVFRYLTFRTGGAVLTAMVISFVIGPPLIRWLKIRQGKGQPIRTDGP